MPGSLRAVGGGMSEMIQIPSSLVEFILLGPSDDRRQLQDSPILGDVWVDYGRAPSERRDLLISPYRGEHARDVAREINAVIAHDEKDPANIAFLQGLIVARLKFEEVMRFVVPKTKWWISRRAGDDSDADELDDKDVQAGTTTGPAPPAHKVIEYTAEKMKLILNEVLEEATAWNQGDDREAKKLSALDRFMALSAILLWAGSTSLSLEAKQPPAEQINNILQLARTELEVLITRLLNLTTLMAQDTTKKEKVWQISRNRSAMPAITRSVPAVKADAATTLFKVDCSAIGWAVVDSGIDGAHPAFKDKDGKSRIKRSFSFKNFHRIVSLSNIYPEIRKTNLAVLMKDSKYLLKPLDEQQADKELESLANDVHNRIPVQWDLVESFIEINPDTDPRTNHGTHVAGIIGANKSAAVKDETNKAVEKARRRAEEDETARLDEEKENTEEEAAKNPAEDAVKKAEEAIKQAGEKAAVRAKERASRRENPDIADGMCPDIQLYDFRVLGGGDLKDTEFAIIAALQYIRYLNDRDIFLTIHGVNMSLSIPHDVRNFACGRTPICEEAERLVASGVVVVAAAGNHGYKSFETKEGAYDSYAAFSITDPGNADSVLTVGATHRFWPHTYGISFFSSRGPTGDGRLKPDLVAPGEKIRAPLPCDSEGAGQWGDLDGTSMAAPHVSGAAAMLMARYSELVGQPRRIKQILCESATDLGRERSFQGHGMLDVLRAFQSI